MADPRSGVRRSKRVNNVQDNPAVLVPPACPGTRIVPASRGRGRGSRAMNQGKNVKLTGAGINAHGNTGLDLPVGNLIFVRELGFQKSAEKLAVADDEGSTSPFPEKGDNKGFLVCKRKMATSTDTLCCLCPPPFQKFLEMVTNMRFNEEPNYSKLISLFDGSIALNASLRPIRTDGVAKFGQKRGRSLVELEDGGQPRKNIRLGSPVSQWISVFNYRLAMKQRNDCCWNEKSLQEGG